MCKEEKDFSAFAKATSTRDGYQRGCRDCKAAQYKKNSEQYKAGSRKARERRYDKLAELKNKPCMDCGNSYPPYVMEFDHISDDKVASISHLMQRASWKAITDEIAKCELVCANCHRLRTYDRLTAEGKACMIAQ